MGVVAFIAHLTAFWIAKCKQSSDSSSGQNKGSSSGGCFGMVLNLGDNDQFPPESRSRIIFS